MIEIVALLMTVTSVVLGSLVLSYQKENQALRELLSDQKENRALRATARLLEDQQPKGD